MAVLVIPKMERLNNPIIQTTKMTRGGGQRQGPCMLIIAPSWLVKDGGGDRLDLEAQSDGTGKAIAAGCTATMEWAREQLSSVMK